MALLNKISLLVVLTVLLSCEKSELEPDTQDHHRMREILFFDDGEPERKLEFSYDGEKLKTINYYFKTNNGWKQDYRSDFSIQEGGFTHEYYYVKDDTLKYKWKNIYKVQNDQLIEDLYYIGHRNEWHINSRWNYVYEDGKLSSYKIFRYADDDWKERAFSYFLYENSQIQEHTYYEIHDDKNVLVDRDTFYWENNKLVQYVDYNRQYGEMELNSRSNFTYIGDNATEIELQRRRHDEWSFYNTTYYEYDIEGMLIGQRVNWGEEMKFFYEEGKGNFGIIFYLPEERAFNKPMFKAAEEFGDEKSERYSPRYIDHLMLKKNPGLIGMPGMLIDY